jgi:hypothetical protein
MNRREAKREAQRAQSNREELLERMARALPEDGRLEAFDGLFLGRLSKPMESVHTLYRPAFCLIAQGSKRVLLGDEVYRYDPGHYLIFTVDLPIVFRVEAADEEHPYLGLTLNLDPDLVASVMLEAEAMMRRGDADVKAIGVTSMSPLQFQKQIRLQEARRLMLGEDLDAASAGQRVGYEDPAYFSRDYKKLFGAPPHRDISRLRSRLELGGSVVGA